MPINRRVDLVTLSWLLLSTLVGAASAGNVSEAEIGRYLAAETIQIAQLREHGPQVMPVLAQLYESAACFVCRRSWLSPPSRNLTRAI